MFGLCAVGVSVGAASSCALWDATTIPRVAVLRATSDARGAAAERWSRDLALLRRAVLCGGRAARNARAPLVVEEVSGTTVHCAWCDKPVCFDCDRPDLDHWCLECLEIVVGKSSGENDKAGADAQASNLTIQPGDS